jgi:anthranilate/para-aminobenzoate synthase component I
VALRRLARLPAPVALARGFLGEPVLSAAPVETVRLGAEATGDPLAPLSRLVPPPGGLVAGALAYELCRSLERHPGRAKEDAVPRAQLQRYPASYWPERGRIEGEPAAAGELLRALTRPAPDEGRALPLEVGAAATDLDGAGYRRAIGEIQRLIGAGDVYQVNLSRGLTLELRAPGTVTTAALALQERLAAGGWAEQGAFLDLGDRAVVSSSPELLLAVQGDRLLTRPIKGTRPRGSTPNEDRALARELRASEKDRAEHLMIVDVSRNDLGRVAQVGSVAVARLAEVERTATVQHLVSDVGARLTNGRGPWEALRALYPAASITGAPKIRATEVIDALEPEARGIYCGSVVALAGDRATFSVAIRTCTVDAPAGQPRIRWRAGGGIVADSDPEQELAELGWKSRAFFRALGVTWPT